MYALVEIKGKQYRVEQDSLVKVDRLESDPGASVEFRDVVLVRSGSDVRVGTPFVDGVAVKAQVEEHGRDRKVVVFKHKRRKNYRRTRGHRQHFTTIRVTGFDGVA